MRHSLFVTDLDGTLLRDGLLDPMDLKALEDLGEIGASRSIATGRSRFSLFKDPARRSLPVDYLILSSGACVMDGDTGELLHAQEMTREEAGNAADILMSMELDFAVHREVPDNHRFLHWCGVRPNADMERRIAIYNGFCAPFDGELPGERFTQLVVIVPPDRSPGTYRSVLDVLGETFSVIRTTSPLDGESLWIEVFSRGVCKSSGAQWLARRLGVDRSAVAAVGNDYNDTDLLDWAASSFVMKDSPPEVSSGRTVVSSVAQAVRCWLDGFACPGAVSG